MHLTMNEWKALNARITLFPTAPLASSSFSALEVYQKVWGVSPDSFQTQQNPILPSIAQGRRDGIMVHCLAHPSRIDLNLAPPPGETAELELMFIEDQDKLYAELRKIIDVIAKGVILPSVSRVGLGLQFATAKPNPEEANKTLTQVMPPRYRTNLTNEEDFIFQVNLQRKSKEVQDVTMNFITKWSVDKVQVFRMFPGPSFAGTLPTQIFIVASLALDYNSFAEKLLNPEDQSRLLLECLTEASAMQRTLN